MPLRTLSKQITFHRPFRLSGFGHVQPPGIYRIDTVEELIEAVSFSAWKRVSTTMPLTYNGLTEYMPVDPGELDRALASDVAPRTNLSAP